MAAEDFDTAVEELYGAPPAQFIATRNAAVKRARAAGDRDLADRIKQLRRPTAAAALLNQQVRSGHTGDLDALITLGEKLRTAQRELDVPAMRSLGAQRAPHIAAVLDAVSAQAQEELTAAVREQVSQTLTAAVADADAAQAVRSGRLVSALSYSGFGEVDVSAAVAVPLARRAASGQQAADDAEDDEAVGPDAGARPATEGSDARAATDGPDARAEADAAAAAAAERALEERLAVLEKAHQAEGAAQQSADLAERSLAAAKRTAKGARARLAKASAARAAAEAEVAEARRRVRRS